MESPEILPFSRENEALFDSIGDSWDIHKEISELTNMLTDDQIKQYYPNSAYITGAFKSHIAKRLVGERYSEKLSNPGADIKAPEYFKTFATALNNGKQLLGKRGELIQPAQTGLNKLLAENSQVYEEFIALGIEYGNYLKYRAQTHATGYIGWAGLLIENSAISRAQLPQAYAYKAGKTHELPEDFLDPSSPTTPWRRMWLGVGVVNQDRDVQHYRGYVFGANIAEKDPDFLLDALSQLENGSSYEMFGYKSNRAGLTRWGYDLFQMVLNEAAASGWNNAQVLVDQHEKIQKRDLPLHSIIIHISNLVTDTLNKKGGYEEGVKLEKLRPTDLANTPEAIERCLHVVFEMGQQPKDKEALNYLISAQISSQIFANAHRYEHEASS